MSVKIEAISEHALELGEGPHWDARTQALYFVDLVAQMIHKYSAAGHTKTKIDGHASFIIPVEGRLNQFVVGMGRDVVVLRWDGIEGSPARVLRTLGSVDAHATVPTILNDGKADPRGRLYTGSMAHGDVPTDVPPHKGSLYRVDQGGVTKLDDQISLSNGLAWDQEAGAMYYVDSMENKIRRYDYDIETGDISNMAYIFDLKSDKISEGGLDGMTIDTDGNLWVAVFGSHCVYQISPRGELLREIRLPAKQVASCTFGGADMDVLFVTTAFLDTGAGKLKPPNGYTFKITGLGVKGHPNVNVKL